MDSEASAIEFLSVGDLIGQAVRLCWRNTHMILQVLLVPAIGCMLGKICMYWPFTLYKLKGAFPSLSMILIGIVCGLLGVAILLYAFWIMMLRLFVLMKLFVSERTNLDKPSFDSAYKSINSMQGAILGVFTLNMLVTMVISIGCFITIIITALITRLHIVPAWILMALVAVEILAMFFGSIFISIIYWLAINEIILTGEHVKPAISKTWLLAWPNFWRIIYFVCLSGLVIWLLACPLYLPLDIFYMVELFIKGGQAGEGFNGIPNIQEQIISLTTKVPFYRTVLASAWSSVISMILWPVLYLAWALFYQDLKKRAFAPDLMLKLKGLSDKADAAGG